MCSDIPAETCCANFWPTTTSILGRGLNNDQTDGRDPDSFAVFNGEGGDPCAITTKSYCGGGGGFENFCWATGEGEGGCGSKQTGGSLWHSGDEHLNGRFAKRAVGAVNPNVAGFWDAAAGRHRQFKIGGDVPANVTAVLVEAVRGNVEYGNLSEVVKTFEIN
jgi:hypothetical protein